MDSPHRHMKNEKSVRVCTCYSFCFGGSDIAHLGRTSNLQKASRKYAITQWRISFISNKCTILIKYISTSHLLVAASLTKIMKLSDFQSQESA